MHRMARWTPRAGTWLLLAFLAVGCRKDARDYEAGDRKVLLVGMDGADLDVLAPMLERGQLPRLQRLRSQGIEIRMSPDREPSDVVAMESSKVWTSMATGQSPKMHGIPTLSVEVAGTYDEVPVTSAHRTCSTVWDFLSAYGVNVCVVGWWTTWPAEWVNGVLVSDRFFLDRFDAGPFGSKGRPDMWQVPKAYRSGAPHLTYPDSLADELTKPLNRHEPAASVPLLLHLEGLIVTATEDSTRRNLKMLAQAVRTDFLVKEACLELLRRDPTIQFTAAYLDSLDVASHLFWIDADPDPWKRNRDPALRALVPPEPRLYQDLIARTAVTLDGFVGELHDAMGAEETSALVVSAHGFVPNPDPFDRDYNLNGVLERLGLLQRDPEGGIDFETTQVFDRPSSPWNFIRMLSMNFEGDYPLGFVPATQPDVRASAWDQVSEQLYSVRASYRWKRTNRDPSTGAITHSNTQEIFHGSGAIPWKMQWGVYQAFPADTRFTIAGQECPIDEIFPARTSTGRHDLGGFLLLSLPGEEGRYAVLRDPPLGQDIAGSRNIVPTILALFDLPRQVEGPLAHAGPILWAFRLDAAQQHAISIVPDLEFVVGRDDPTTEVGGRLKELRAYLKNIGYWAPPPPPVPSAGVAPVESSGT